MSFSPEDHKFNWGETVFIKKSAPQNLFPGKIASVCSIVKIELEELKADPTLIEATWLYTVELGDGSSIEISEAYLEKYVGA